MKIKGRPFSQRLYGFGEQVHWKRPLKGPGHAPDGNMGTRWGSGTYVGHDWSSNAYIVIDEADGAIHTHAVQRRPMDERWICESIERITQTPWQLREKREPQVRFQDEVEKVATEVRDPVTNFRRMRLLISDFRTHGFTDGCPQCQHIMEHNQQKPGLGHSERCRARMLSEIGRSHEGQVRLQIQEEKVEHALAKHIELEDRQQGGNVADKDQDRGWEALQPEDFEPPGAATPVPDEPDQAMRSPTSPGGDSLYGEEEPDSMDIACIMVAMDDVADVSALEDIESVLVLESMGSNCKSYKRERRKGFRRILSEI